MFKINSYTDLKVAYEILEIAYESGRSQKAVDLKREMRAFFHRPVSERRIVQDDGIDGYTELLPLPEYIETVVGSIKSDDYKAAATFLMMMHRHSYKYLYRAMDIETGEIVMSTTKNEFQ